MLFIIFAILFLVYYLYATKFEKRSFISRLIQDILAIFPFINLEKDLANKNNYPFKMPKGLKLANKISESKIDGMKVLEMNLDQSEIIIYLHGGCYLYNLNKEQLKMIDKICSKTNNTIYIPLYPLLPDYSYQDAYEALISFYKKIVEHKKPSKIILMGDSAGASLCLGLSTIIQEEKLILPNKLILLSPWLDLSLNNPMIDKQLIKKDKILNKEALIHAGRIWSKDEDLNSPLLSPINAIISPNTKIIIVTGTSDILYPDIALYKSKLLANNSNFELFIYDKMLHVFPIFEIPEANSVIDQLVLIINQ